MKNIILLITLSIIAKFSYAYTGPSIDEELNFKMETQSKEKERGVAAYQEVKTEPEVKKDKAEKKDHEREIASDEEIFNSTNENGIKYWKY
jgi:hypothetical protein